MAGFYPDDPYYRIPYDDDGAVLFHHDNSSSDVTLMPATTLNSEDLSGVSIRGRGGTSWFGIIFGEPYDIDTFLIVYYMSQGSGTSTIIKYSYDTTNGIDGNWTEILFEGNLMVPASDTSIYRNLQRRPLWVEGVISVKWEFRTSGVGGTGSGGLRNLHLFGKPSKTGGEFLRFWHPTLDEEVGPAYFDWGDVYVGGPRLRSFRIKNMSSTHTANGIELSIDALTDVGTPTTVDSHSFSSGGEFSPTLDVGDLEPQEVSQVFTVQYSPTGAPELGLKWARVMANVEVWQ